MNRVVKMFLRVIVERPPWLNFIDGIIVKTRVPFLPHHP